MHKKLKNSERKFVRAEKARIRSQFFDIKKQYELIQALYATFAAPLVAVQAANEQGAKAEKAVKTAVKTKAKTKKHEKPTNKAKNKN